MLNSQTPILTLGSEPYNEFNAEYSTSFSALILFADKEGDPINSCLLCEISDYETESFAEKSSI